VGTVGREAIILSMLRIPMGHRLGRVLLPAKNHKQHFIRPLLSLVHLASSKDAPPTTQ
jgi:hypothetical protein